MIKVDIGTNTKRKSVVVTDPENMTLEELLTQENVNSSFGTIFIDGTPISKSQYDENLSDLEVSDGSFIMSIAKADNA